MHTPTPTDSLAWVTGASSGIGEHVALALAAEGWTVLASARGAAALATLAARTAGPGRIIPAPLDVTDAAGVKAVLAAHGPVALAVLNAGTYRPDAARDLDPAQFGRTMDVNLMGVVNSLAAILPGMIGRRQGHVVIVSSVAGYRGLPRSLAYGASKAALINLAESLKLDVERHGIKTQLVCPGFIKTPLTDRNDFPMPFLMPVERAAARLVAGLKGNGFQITFPRRFTWPLLLLRRFPDALYFMLACRIMPK
ncbi:SDR family NAD(P)-dependent oxidoreductase [Niveispirillum fermenti]|uniref:SDR family NAD(P)-dependent oxidoreductase n=1 Tax=Niveispirillum fermenti TaxID=1233113 RepID=UPI003A847C28